MQKLADLDPKLSTVSFLSFDCPVCKGDNAHKIRVPLAPAVDGRGQSWQHEGEYPDKITLTPSVNAGCWHGHIIKGELTEC